MKKRTHKKKQYILGLLLLLALFGTGGGTVVYAMLENSNSTAVRSVQVKDSEIENSTLIIGSHLIHISALTDELYEAALESANEFNQNQVYYKSELADGAWFETTDASSIADITTSGNPVDKSVIEALEFTHKTGSDGITIDLRTGKSVSIFDIPDPYNLEGMQELEPLLLQYQILQNKTDQTESDKIYMRMIKAFFELDVKSSVTDDHDVSLRALEEYRQGLSPREKPTMWTEQTEKIMASVDADRRIEALTRISDELDTLENKASGISGSNQTTDASTDEETLPLEFTVSSDIISAIGDCIQNVSESMTAYESKRITDSGTTASAKAQYQYSMELITRARSSDTQGCDEIMQKLCDLENILSGVISDVSGELDTLTTSLVQQAYTQYKTDLAAGVSEDYKTAQTAGSSQAVLSRYLTEQKNYANADRLEYQTMLDAQFERMDNGKAQTYVIELINGVPDLEKTIQGDAAGDYLKETLKEHLQWLQSSYAELVKNSGDSTEMDKLQKEKDELENKRQDALDQNDLAEAKRFAAELEAKQKEIDDLLKQLSDILNSPNSTEADKAKARAGMGESNTTALLSEMAAELSSAIRNGDTESSELENMLAALKAAAQLNPDAGKAALEHVQEALDTATGIDDSLLSDMRSAAAEALQEADKDSDRTLSANEIQGLIEEQLGQTFASASANEQAGALLAVEWYGAEKKDQTALNISASLAKQAYEANNSYIYQKHTKSEAYMSLQALGNVSGYRYIFDDTHCTVTLQKGKAYYLFTQAKTDYEASGSKNTLNKAAELNGTLYISGEDGEKIFEVKAEYLQNAQYGVVGTQQVEAQAKEIYQQLTDRGN